MGLALAPDRSCDAPYELELALLLLVSDPVALQGRSEPTLGAQGESFERNVPGRLFDSELQVGLGFELRFLGRHQAEDGDPVFR